MENPCPTCGAPVSSGAPFCKECNTPLIRVSIGEAPAVAPPPFLEGAVPQRPDFRVLQKPQVEWSHGIPAAALAGVLGSLLMMVPFAALGPAMVAAGAFSVVLYRRRLPAAPLTIGMGAKLGGLGGAFGFSIFAVLSALATIIFGPDRLRTAMLEAIEKSRAANPDPQMTQMFEFMKTPEGLAVAVVIGTVMLLVISLVLSTAGGAATASYYRRRR